ncbi:hypothetical protein NDI37_20700 [Funiculus sociatus GB2-A5]|uniref:Uncharacterized protein n=1 Tax=Funiculus sociatus GB2-A5 TaxID=2933946 RepID=A0ABV0JTU1_9CYAN|nr:MULTISPECIES: hypothetical protein [unclassified Trichocoleus]MBD1908962.1 hypothetical protein [Trichocoleus sp. FACHB-832]MBD2062996.1 hypothetical protein [Trichocoleus sp. FACHB-6]
MLLKFRQGKTEEAKKANTEGKSSFPSVLVIFSKLIVTARAQVRLWRWHRKKVNREKRGYPERRSRNILNNSDRVHF